MAHRGAQVHHLAAPPPKDKGNEFSSTRGCMLAAGVSPAHAHAAANANKNTHACAPYLGYVLCRTLRVVSVNRRGNARLAHNLMERGEAS